MAGVVMVMWVVMICHGSSLLLQYNISGHQASPRGAENAAQMAGQAGT
jgi:hypothetical protein